MKKEETEQPKTKITPETTEKESVIFDRFTLRSFIQQGRHHITCKNGTAIDLLYHPYAYRLESGAPMPSEQITKNEDESLEHFFKHQKRPEEILPLVVQGHIEDRMINWMIEHIRCIEDVVGFPIQNVKVKEEIHETIGFYEAAMVDLYAEDGFGGKIVMNGERSVTTDRTFLSMLCTAILIEAKKIIWVANEIKEDHQIIVKWLNEYFSKRITIYLVEATSVPLGELTGVMCQFRLVESPMSGWMNHD